MEARLEDCTDLNACGFCPSWDVVKKQSAKPKNCWPPPPTRSVPWSFSLTPTNGFIAGGTLPRYRNGRSASPARDSGKPRSATRSGGGFLTRAFISPPRPNSSGLPTCSELPDVPRGRHLLQGKGPGAEGSPAQPVPGLETNPGKGTPLLGASSATTSEKEGHQIAIRTLRAAESALNDRPVSFRGAEPPAPVWYRLGSGGNRHLPARNHQELPILPGV